jgi:tryptophan synthase alpha chain
MTELDTLFAGTRAADRAALIGYIPAGYPTVADSEATLRAMVEAGCDLVEVGVPYSDPVLDGPTVQAATQQALRGGFRLRDTFEVVAAVTEAGGRAVVMTYFNPVHHYGVDAFARDLGSAGGLGVITPDLLPDDDAGWCEAARRAGLDRIFLVAPSSTADRIATTTAACSGFVYATSVMGVTGARATVSDAAAGVVSRVREHTSLPVGVGLGVRSGAQAAEVAGFADAVIVGSAFVTAAADSETAVRALTGELSRGVRGAVTTG